MSASEPAIRVSYAKTVVATIKQSPTPERDALLARLDVELRTHIRESSLLDWMAASEFVKLPELVLEVLGTARARAFWRSNLLVSLERTLLSPLRLGAIALYGESPGSLLRMAPQAWQLVSRNGGKCSFSFEPPGPFTLMFKQLPPELRTPGMLQLWAGGSESCIELLKFSGRAEAELDARDPSTAVIRVHWLPR